MLLNIRLTPKKNENKQSLSILRSAPMCMTCGREPRSHCKLQEVSYGFHREPCFQKNSLGLTKRKYQGQGCIPMYSPMKITNRSSHLLQNYFKTNAGLLGFKTLLDIVRCCMFWLWLIREFTQDAEDHKIFLPKFRYTPFASYGNVLRNQRRKVWHWAGKKYKTLKVTRRRQ